MKKNLASIPMLLSIVAIMGGCSTVNKAHLDRDANIRNAKENSSNCFVRNLDGTIQHYTSLELVTGLFTAPHLLADGKIIISSADITAYQNEDHYAISQDNFQSGRHSKVAVEALPGFAVRIAKGSLNVYCKKFFNGAKAVDELFIQSGDEGKILAYSPELLNEMVKDHREILDLLNSKNNTVTSRLLAIAEIYNQQHLISKN
jgi:hypothetical protein